MTRRPLFIALSILPVLVACSAPAPADEAPYRSGELMAADRAFATETARDGAAGWTRYFMPDGVMFPPSGRVDGTSAILEVMEPAFGEGAPRLTWEPASEVVSASADLGYTLGRWESVAQSSTGEDSVVAAGNYVTIWRKDATGEWRVAVDIGNQDAPPGP